MYEVFWCERYVSQGSKLFDSFVRAIYFARKMDHCNVVIYREGKPCHPKYWRLLPSRLLGENYQ